MEKLKWGVKVIDKKHLRKKILTQRQQIKPQHIVEYSHSIMLHIENLIENKEFQHVFTFLPFRNEPDLRPMMYRLMANKITISVPKISSLDGEMEFYPIQENSKLEKNQYGILEPVIDDEAPSIPESNTLIIIPTVAMDEFGYRLGYGGGFFDRYLEAYPYPTKLGVGFFQFILEEIPTEPWDTQLDYVCTEHFLKRIK